MELDSSFSVPASIDAVWDVLMDFDRIAAAVPGAEILNKLSDEAFQVGVKVKLGPVTLQYRGLVNVVERDAAAHRAAFSGKAQETRGQGMADGSATLLLTEADGMTTGTVHADLNLSGRAAAMGKSVINSVTQQMMALFAENLQAMVLGGPPPDVPARDDAREASQPGPPATDSPATDSSASDSPATEPPATEPPARPAAAPPRPAAMRPAPMRPADTSLDGLALVKGVISDQLTLPRLVGLLAAVGLVGFLIGRGRRPRS